MNILLLVVGALIGAVIGFIIQSLVWAIFLHHDINGILDGMKNDPYLEEEWRY